MRIGGVANSTTVNSGGSMDIESGGTATNIFVASGGVLGITVAPETYIQGTSNGSAFEMKNAQISGYTVNNGYMLISSGGVANSTTVNSDGSMYISSGGTATNIIWTPCVGHVSAENGAYVTYASSYSGVYFGSVDRLLSSAQTMNNIVVSIGSMYVMSGGVANRIKVYGSTFSSGCIYISSGGVANSTTVNSMGSMYIRNGGVANSTTHCF